MTFKGKAWQFFDDYFMEFEEHQELLEEANEIQFFDYFMEFNEYQELLEEAHEIIDSCKELVTLPIGVKYIMVKK